MAQFDEEEFLSDSKVIGQFNADQSAIKKKNAFCIPNTNSNEKLDYTCFSGFIGDGNLSVDSRKVSVGEFFRRKCGGTGHLNSPKQGERPSFGLDPVTPQRHRILKPLVNQTMSPEEGKFSDI